MKQYKINDNAATGLVAGIMIFIVIIVGIMGFLMITDAFNKQYDNAINDSNTTTTGIYLNNTTPYESVKTISTGITNNIPAAILLAFLLAVIIMVMVVWAILKKGD